MVFSYCVFRLRKMLATRTVQVRHRYPKLAPDIKDFPVELVLNIIDLLGPESVMALSLVSSRLRLLLRDVVDPMRKSRQNMQRLLLLLEHDSPHLLACFVCNKLYDWRRSTGYACPNYNFKTHPRPLQICHETCRVHPAVIDLIFRAQKLGPMFGLPLSYFKCHDRQWTSTQFGMDIHRTFEARVDNNRLILCSTSTCTFDTDQDAEKQLLPFKATLCGHMNFLLTRAIRDTRAEILSIVDKKSEDYELYGVNEYNCTECPTDMSISIVASSSSKCFGVTIVAFHKFNARTPTRLTPTIKIQNNNGVQNAFSFPNITVDRYLRGQYEAWGGRRQNMLIEFIQRMAGKCIRQRIELVDPDQTPVDEEKLQFWVHIPEKKKKEKWTLI